ncbi:MAG: SAM-dependent methyltransferase [Cyclobacteriaceae bacterium]|jgi:16S rRNA (cytidine1402-2'-O)-methyltransferase
MSKPGKIYLIPNYLSTEQGAEFISDSVKSTVKKIAYYLVENVRTSRRFLSSLQLGLDISTLIFEVMDKRFDASRLPAIFQPVLDGADLGVQSEAGLPGIADPGRVVVSFAHKLGIEVVTLPGPTSIILGLISSGFNGQQFTFHGYLPIDKKERTVSIKEFEQTAKKSGYTQIFMETPYRNNDLLKTLLLTLKEDTYLYVGKDLTGENEWTKSLPVKEWKGLKAVLSKTPAIFAIGSAS